MVLSGATLMNRTCGILSSATIAIFSLYAQDAAVLHEGTPFRMKINRTISSADATVGETVDFSTLDDVKVGDFIVVPKGSTAIATVTEAQSKRRMGRGGKLNVNIDYVRLPTGEKLALRGVQGVTGGGHVGAMTGAMVATSIVFFPAAPLFLFVKGKDITIPQGHEITVYSNSEYKVDSGKLSSLQGPSSRPAEKQTGPALTNDDILKMKTIGLSDELIVQKIKMSPSNYKLGVDELTKMKSSGLSDPVIGAMMSASAGH
jgi:hypothetical protein